MWAGHALGAQQGVLGDIRLYGGWGTAFVHGQGLPVDDEKWQYPPGAILVFAVPALARVLVGLSYRVGFPLFMLAVDAAVTAALARTGRPPTDPPTGPGTGSPRSGGAPVAHPTGLAPSRPPLDRGFGPAVVVTEPVSRPPEGTAADHGDGLSPAVAAAGARGRAWVRGRRSQGSGDGGTWGSGARVWLVGTTLLGPVTLARFDLVPTACALVGLLLLASRGRRGQAGLRYGWAGFAAAVGALIKAWPAFLLISLGRPVLASSGRPPGGPLGGAALASSGRASGGPLGWRRLWGRPVVRAIAGAGAAVLITGLILVAARAGGDLLGFVGAQRSRGLQLEAVPATVFVVVRMFGDGETARYEYGSLQFGDSAARAVATACSLVEIVIIAVATLWWWLGPAPSRGTAAHQASTAGDRLLALLLIVLVTSRVLSPQYLIWVLGVVAGLVAVRAAGSAPDGLVADPAEARRQADRRAVLVLLLVAAAVSQVIYPWRYNDVIQGRPVTSVLLVARNALLLAACWRAVRISAWRPAPRAPRTAEPTGQGEPAAGPSAAHGS